jgi:hypothetical protein
MSEHMPNRPDILSLSTAPIPETRGVHSFVDPRTHERLYYAVDSRGQLVNGELRSRMSDETEAMVVRELWIDLEKTDGISGPPKLSLYVGGQPRA